jgi:hypothetical protein
VSGDQNCGRLASCLMIPGRKGKYKLFVALIAEE